MFSLISILYSVFNEHFLNLNFFKFLKHLNFFKCFKNLKILLDWVDSNHRPHAYQACALTTWATIHYLSGFLPLSLPLWVWRWWDSNPWPPACRAGALPAELHPHIEWKVKSEKWKVLVEIWTSSNFFLFFYLLSLIFSLFSLSRFFPSSLLERSLKIEQWNKDFRL